MGRGVCVMKRDGDLFEDGVKHVEMAAEVDSINSSELIVVGSLAS